MLAREGQSKECSCYLRLFPSALICPRRVSTAGPFALGKSIKWILLNHVNISQCCFTSEEAFTFSHTQGGLSTEPCFFYILFSGVLYQACFFLFLFFLNLYRHIQIYIAHLVDYGLHIMYCIRSKSFWGVLL